MDAPLVPYTGLAHVPQNAELPLSVPSVSESQREFDFQDELSPPCAAGFKWSDESSECVPQIDLRAPKCPHGFTLNTRLNECRRGKYGAGPQKDGKIKKWWDKHIAKTKAKSATKAATVAPKTSDYTDGWFGYGYDFGRNNPRY